MARRLLEQCIFAVASWRWVRRDWALRLARGSMVGCRHLVALSLVLPLYVGPFLGPFVGKALAFQAIRLITDLSEIWD